MAASSKHMWRVFLSGKIRDGMKHGCKDPEVFQKHIKEEKVL